MHSHKLITVKILEFYPAHFDLMVTNGLMLYIRGFLQFGRKSSWSTLISPSGIRVKNISVSRDRKRERGIFFRSPVQTKRLKGLGHEITIVFKW